MADDEIQAGAARLLEAALADVTAAILSLHATQPALALDALTALGEAVLPYLKGDRRAEGLRRRLQVAAELQRELG